MSSREISNPDTAIWNELGTPGRRSRFVCRTSKRARSGRRYSSARSTPLSAPVAAAVRSRHRNCPLGSLMMAPIASKVSRQAPGRSPGSAIATKSEKLGSPATKARSLGRPSGPRNRVSAAHLTKGRDQYSSCPRTTVTGTGSLTCGNDRTVANTSWRETPTASRSHRSGSSTSARVMPVRAAELRRPAERRGGDFLGVDLLRRKRRDSSFESGPLRRIKQSPVLQDGVAVGHSRDVIRHRAGPTGCTQRRLQSCDGFLVLRRH